MPQDIKKSEAEEHTGLRYADPFAVMRGELERLFDRFSSDRFGAFPSLWRGNGEGPLMPSVDLHEGENEIMIEAELPGVEEKDINLTVRDGVLSITGEKKSEREEKKDDYYLSERSFGQVQRAFRLPDYADEDHIEASFDSGVLRVKIPKRPGAEKTEKSIPIRNG